MEYIRAITLLQNAINHIESFEEDESEVVLKSLGFTQKELVEIRNYKDDSADLMGSIGDARGHVVTIEYDVLCFERTLTIKFPDSYESMKDTILELVDRFYTFWHNTTCTAVQDTCLEEFIMDQLYETGYKWQEWDSIPYGSDYEPRERLWVCEHCLQGIESTQGYQVQLKHRVDETDAVESKCDWCHNRGFDVLYELI